jgi:GalNAc-alpha-(1->4)-GalNAc-alpha-(1->3)-diNAcBac-PP-undecaprenol alpha-1,4-N-acetyl-D-galactosaminyltransferase
MRLTLVISSLSAGGAEKVVAIMSNYWTEKGWQITLLTFDDGATRPFYDLDSRIKRIPLDLEGDSKNSLAAVWNNLRRVSALRSAIRQSKPDCVISFLDQVNVLTILAARRLKIPVIVMEQTYPPSHHIGRTWNLLRNRIYPRAAQVVGVTARALRNFSPRIQSRACVIHNPVLLPPLTGKRPAGKLLDRPALLAVGRLNQHKGYRLLLRAFAQLKDQHTNWTLTILGEGPLRHELEDLGQQLGISNRVKLLGRVSNPYDFLTQADIFVMASRYEGFPLALCEAMACGLPVIATDCPSGPKEIIRDGVDGLLVPTDDVDALARAINCLIEDEAMRLRLGSCATDVIERFGLEKIMRTWEELLDRVVLVSTKK